MGGRLPENRAVRQLCAKNLKILLNHDYFSSGFFEFWDSLKSLFFPSFFDIFCLNFQDMFKTVNLAYSSVE